MKQCISSGLIACAALSFLALSSGCGSGSEPFSTFSASNATPQLNLPVSDSVFASVYRSFSQSGAVSAIANDGIDINVNSGLGQTAIAPAAGFISYVDNTSNAGIVYIVHSPHLMTRVSLLQAVTVLPGAIVQAGSGLGLTGVSQPVHFTVYFDNAVVCPLSFLTLAEQKIITNQGGQPACK